MRKLVAAAWALAACVLLGLFVQQVAISLHDQHHAGDTSQFNTPLPLPSDDLSYLTPEEQRIARATFAPATRPATLPVDW